MIKLQLEYRTSRIGGHLPSSHFHHWDLSGPNQEGLRLIPSKGKNGGIQDIFQCLDDSYPTLESEWTGTFRTCCKETTGTYPRPKGYLQETFKSSVVTSLVYRLPG